MFAAMAGEGGCCSNEIAAMAAVLSGRNDLLNRSDPAQAVWMDESGAFAAACRGAALLPEDPPDNRPSVDLELIFVCRARLDDRSGLLQLLQIEPTRGAALSDAEILRLCYKRWREETPRHVYGDFAFVAWERWSRRTVAATDHMGNFPLFYCRADGRVLFATQLGTLLACPTVRPNLDLECLRQVAVGKPIPCRTMFEEINVLPGGQLLVHHEGLLRIERWWQPDTTPREVHAHPRDYVAEARALFDAAVISRLRARGGVIATMSGGLDSTLVAATAARHMSTNGKVLEALTAVPHDDVAWATAVANFQPNIRQRLISTEGMTPLDILPVAHSLAHTPVGNPARLVSAWQMTSRAAHNRIRIILCADHGNQSISYDGHLGDASFVGWRRFAAAAQHTWDRVRCLGAGPPGANITSPDRQWIRGSIQDADTKGSVSEREMFARAMMTAVTPTRVDFMAQFGVQWLDPTADRRLLERLLTFPLHIFLVGNRPRGLARELAHGRLPDTVRLRRARDTHLMDQIGWFTQRADDYRRAFQSLRNSTICPEFLDLPGLEPLVETLCAGGGTAAGAATVHRALDAGLFAVAVESGQSLGPGQSAANASGRPAPRLSQPRASTENSEKSNSSHETVPRLVGMASNAHDDELG